VGWRSGEVWFDVDVLWFREEPRAPLGGLAAAGGAIALPRFGPVETGLEASRRRRLAAKAARKRRFAVRTVPAVAIVVGSSAVLPVAALRNRSGAQEAFPLLDDPPSMTFHLADFPFPLPAARRAEPAATPAPRIEWRTATSVGLPYAGHLHGATQLPLEGPDWVTWNPGTDSRPNLPGRLYGHERTIRTVVEVLAAYRREHPNAPLVVVGDISFRGGGAMDQHVSHQNGLDVDVYYPRRDGRLLAPTSTSQIDRRLAQSLLDRFVGVGARMVFVGYSTGLRGPRKVVVPYPKHENHMHVRFWNPD
jgi:hypothetical protein